MATKQYIVTFDAGADPDSVASELRSQGVQVDNIMRDVGIISGSADDAAVAALRGARNVLDVSESAPIGVPPAESSVQ